MAKLLLLALVGLGFGGYIAFGVVRSRSYPTTMGVIDLEGLDGRVEVIRDSRGVAHIYASSMHDLFLAQGFVHGQERFWQMEVWRRTGSGQLAELFGEDLVPTDTFLRTLGWRQRAEVQDRRLTGRPRRALDAYVDGVNAYLEGRSPGELSLEYSLLGLQGPVPPPEPWVPAHSLTWGMAMAWDLRGNMDLEIARALLLGRLPRSQVARLFPRYPFDRHPTIVDWPTDAEEAPRQAALLGRPEVRSALRRAAANAARLDALGRGTAEADLGSNSWVVAGSRTTTGEPILANDPHLASQIPSIWYQIGLHCAPVTEACPMDAVGFSFAGVPGVIIGHNAHIAWGFTNLYPDVMDLYIERLHPSDPDRYEVDGEWVEMEVRTETIRVAGGDDLEVRVRRTRHGPVISEAYGALRGFDEAAGVAMPARAAVALRWTALETERSLVEPILGLDLATNWQEFRQALRTFTAPAQNVVYADRQGNIGYQAPGDIPIRAAGDGRLPVPGWTGEYEWVGHIDFDELPRVFNPDEGYVATANNAVVGPEYPHLITTDWCCGYRARRIVDLIEASDRLDVDAMTRIQLDSYSLNAERLVPALLELDLSAAPEAAAVRDQFRQWDRRMASDSRAAAAFAVFWRHLLQAAFADELPERPPRGSDRWFLVVDHLLDRPDDSLWDDVGTEGLERRDDILREALGMAAEELGAPSGAPPSWGRLHQARFVHKTLGRSGVSLIERLFNRLGPSVSGSSGLVNATGWDAARGYEVTWLPSMRMVVDLADLSRSVAIHTTGQSGHAGHRHYDDMISDWATGRTAPMLWERAEVEADAEATLTLR